MNKDRENFIRKTIASDESLQTWSGHLDIRIPELKMASKAFRDRSLGDVLEIGCGNGLASAWFSADANKIKALDLPEADHGAHAIGFERPKKLFHALGVKNVELVGGSAEGLPFGDQSFDSVMGFFVLEHVPNKERAAAECYRVMRSGALAVFHVPAAAWSFIFFPAFYQETFFRVAKKVFSILKSKIFRANPPQSQAPAFEKVRDAASFKKAYPNFPFPEPHGAYRNWWHELCQHRVGVWEGYFREYSKVEVRALSVLPRGLFTLLLGPTLGVKVFSFIEPLDRLICCIPGAKYVAQFLELRAIK